MGRAMTLGRTKPERPRRGYSRREALALLGATAATMGSPSLAQMAPMGVGGPDTSAPGAPSDGTVEILHGIRVEDPFRPLEDPSRADSRFGSVRLEFLEDTCGAEMRHLEIHEHRQVRP